MSLMKTVLFDLNRVLSFGVNRILSFDLNRILTWDVGRALRWPIPPMLLKGMAGWFLASITLQMMGRWGGAVAVFIAAATAGVFVLPDLVRRTRRDSEHT